MEVLINITPLVESDRALEFTWPDRAELIYWFRRIFGQAEIDDEIRYYRLEPILRTLAGG